LFFHYFVACGLRLLHNVRVLITDAKQTRKRCPLLGGRFLISRIRRPPLGNGSVNNLPAAIDTHAAEERYFVLGPCQDVISKGQG
jgi:hypothetical protein